MRCEVREMSNQKEKLNKLSAVLGLKRRVVGVRFLLIEKEFDECPAEKLDTRITYCRMVAHAMEGKHIKATNENFTCQGGPEMLGMRDLLNYEKSGKQFDTFRLYGDMAIAREVQSKLLPIDHHIYGVELAPLEELEKADVVIMICDTWQAMRVLQGYTHQFGMAEKIGMIGNQGICSDLTARPYMNNDINISLLCQGARLSTNSSDGEVGVGFPTKKFWFTVDGIFDTINSATDDRRKREIAERISEAGVTLDEELEFGFFYANYPERYPVEDYK